MEMLRRPGVLLALLAMPCVAALIGCNRPVAPAVAGPPPLRVSFRPSKIPTEGMVAGFNNLSELESIRVIAVFVQGKGEKAERSYRLDREIKPLDSISFGWIESNGWKLKPGDKLRVRCDRYQSDLECEVPK
jgi:hypothetical protein